MVEKTEGKVTIAHFTSLVDNLFKTMDTNKNGKLEKKEVRAFTEITQKLTNPDVVLNEDVFNEQFNL